VAKDYYHILGVAPDATLAQIKSAYRTRAKCLHPDYYDGGCQPFQDVQEAYEVLGDPGRRQVYDDELARARRLRRAPGAVRPEPLRSRRPPVEPLDPFAPAGPAPDPWDTGWGQPDDRLFEELLGRLWGDLPRRYRTGPAEEVHIEVQLTRTESRRGGRFSVVLPVEQRCPTCHGEGEIRYVRCPRCKGRGVVTHEYPLEVAFPGGIIDGDTGSVSLESPGMRPVRLTVHFRVSPW
jgi:DnaJ-class molecular chaperone